MPHGQQRAEFFGAYRRRIGERETGCAREILDHRMERAIAVIGGTLQIDPRMRFARKLLLQRLDHARFADPGFADHGHHLAFALPRQVPAFAHQAHFMRPADQRQASGTDRGKAAFERGFAADLPGRYRAGKAL